MSKERLNLPNKCYIGKMSVKPANWKQAGASIKTDWKIQYRFYDPSEREKFPKGMLRIVKGMNKFHTLQERRAETQTIMQAERDLLEYDGWNPIKDNYSPVDRSAGDIPKSAAFMIAMESALKKVTCCHAYKLTIKSTLRFVTPAALQLGYYSLPVGDIQRKHIRRLLDTTGQMKATWTASTFNNYRKHLQMLFEVLIDQEAIEYNPVVKIKKQEQVQKITETLSRKQRREIDLHLKKKGMIRFRIFNRIYFNMGARETELLKVKGKDVNLADQTMKCTILKGKHRREVLKTIPNISLRYWKLALHGCGPDDFVFGRDLQPGILPTTAKQISRRWKAHVKDPLGVTVDFRAFRHGNATELVDKIGEQATADQQGHKGTAMVRKIYDTKQFSRNHEKLKTAGNEF